MEEESKTESWEATRANHSGKQDSTSTGEKWNESEEKINKMWQESLIKRMYKGFWVIITDATTNIMHKLVIYLSVLSIQKVVESKLELIIL